MDNYPKIRPEDARDIDALVATFRSRIENLYLRAYLQGQIDQQEIEVQKRKREMMTNLGMGGHG